MYFIENFEIVVISNDKNTSLTAIHFHKSEKNPLGRRHCHKKSKQILNSCISTIDMPPGVQEVLKNGPASIKLEFGGLVR